MSEQTSVGTNRHHLDSGTETATISAVLDDAAADRDVLSAALPLAIVAAPRWAQGALRLQVSVPLDPPAQPG